MFSMMSEVTLCSYTRINYLYNGKIKIIFIFFFCFLYFFITLGLVWNKHPKVHSCFYSYLDH